MSTTIDKLSTKEVTAAFNAIAARYEDYRPVRKFPSRKVANIRLRDAIRDTGEQVVVLLATTTKRGGASVRFPFYKSGMLASQYVDKCVENGHEAAHARRDVRYDYKQGFIQLV